jgi:hypothetical protein
LASAEYSVNPVSTPVLTRLTAIPPTYFREIFGLAGLGIEPARLDMIELRLQAIHDEFVAAATRAAS